MPYVGGACQTLVLEPGSVYAICMLKRPRCPARHPGAGMGLLGCQSMYSFGVLGPCMPLTMVLVSSCCDQGRWSATLEQCNERCCFLWSAVLQIRV